MNKNRRTLKKRIRAVMLLCTFITILIFSSIIMYLAAELFRSQAIVLSHYFSSSIAQEMNSDYFLEQMGIKGLESFNPEAENAREWLSNLKETEGGPHPNTGSNMNPQDLKALSKEFLKYNETNESLTKFKDPNNFFHFYKPEDMLNITITLNNKTIYSSRDFKMNPLPPNSSAPSRLWDNPYTRRLIVYLDAECAYTLLNSSGEVIGEVNSQVDPRFISIAVVVLGGFILLAALLSFFAAGFISKLLTLPVTVPLKKLDEQVKAAAAGDYARTMGAQITLKKPLMEIQSLAASTNLIINKMKDYNDELGAQKTILENQNEELEAQNEELTESKRQIQEAQSMLIQSERMASVGQLTAAITHEINTPLGAINSNAQICDMFMAMISQNEHVMDDAELSSLVAQMKETNDISLMACQRVIEIIKSLKSFSKLDQAEFQEADINDSLKSVLVLTCNLWKKRITMHEDYGDLPLIRCFPGLLNQVFMNLVVNAIQSISEKGDIFIKTYADNEYVHISVKDTGSGIKEEHMSKIFEPGFSTKSAGTGMGLGLSICYNIIRKHKGEVKVESEVGKGTEFRVSIPLNVTNS